MSYSIATAIEIDRKLRDDFRRRIKDFGIATEPVDPVLAAVFRTFAQQIETLYAETGRIRLALLDELIAGLGIDQRVSRPAQTLVRFESLGGLQAVPPGLELIGEAQSGERLTFGTDASIQVSQARLVTALVYQNGMLQLPRSMELPENLQDIRPSNDPVRAALGANPAIYLAIDNLPTSHLSRHSFFFELGADSFALQHTLDHSPWCLVGPQGELSSHGVLRPRTKNAGVRGLDWLVRPKGGPASGIGDDVPVTLPPGFYGPKLFVMPEVPAERGFLCAIPRAMDGPLARIFGRESTALFSEPRAWLRIGLPSGIENLETSIGSVFLHAVTASNVECINQTVYFDRQGTSIPISQEAGTPAHLVAPLSVQGEAGAPYLPESEPSADEGAGRYAFRNGRIELRPARTSGGAYESFANVRVWVTAGSLGNRVGPGQVKSFAQKKDGANLRLLNPSSAAGGSTVETFEDAQARFARILLSRDRAVTQADIAASARAFDRRIRGAESRAALERTGSGLRRVQKITALLDANDFVDPPAEAAILEQDLAQYLQTRVLYDTGLSVAIRWI